MERHIVGAELVTTPEPGVVFRVWAPAAKRVAVVVDNREVVLSREANGYAAGFVAGIGAGALYRYRLDDANELLPDPATRFQPEGTAGPSRVVGSDFAWTDAEWAGIAADRHVVYEMHLGTFTPAGTWAAAATQLEFLAQLGVTTLEIMPVSEWGGAHNWGYDGVSVFAPHCGYGEPDDLRRFIDRAHALGLAVILDVVYNHLGPDGNVVPKFAPAFFHRDKATDWGEGINYDEPAVREFYIANGVYWIRDFHFDGLRFDATQAIHDATASNIMAEIIAAARAAAPHRTLWMVGENEPQDAKLLRDYGFDALWNDDYHHTARVALTGVIDGYLHDYSGSPQEFIAAIRHGFLYQGQTYPWQRNPRGTSTRGLARARFVHFLENHDQVANLGFGERLVELSDPGTLRALTALTLLTPSIPMLFQGQETGAKQPWEFFCSHTGALGDAVRKGRKDFVKQFQRLGLAEVQNALRDPIAESTFRACVLDPTERDFTRPVVAFHRDLLQLRKTDFSGDEIDAAVLDAHAFVVRCYGDEPNDDRLILVNLGHTFHRAVIAEPLLAAPVGTGWKLGWSSEDVRYGGHGTPTPFTHERLALPGRSTIVCAPDHAAALRLDPPPPSGDKVAVDP